MSFFADREMILSGFAIGFVSFMIGGIILITHEAPIDRYYAYTMCAAGIVLLLVSALTRRSPRNTFLLRLLLAGFALFLLLGFLLKDVIELYY